MTSSPSSRREFIRFVVAGSVASGCPIDEALVSASDAVTPQGALVHGEHFEICHELRDGHSFDRPETTHKAEVVGGGVAGLSAAYFLRGKDWLLLEKEDYFGATRANG